jgi:hypothetical protein
MIKSNQERDVRDAESDVRVLTHEKLGHRYIALAGSLEGIRSRPMTYGWIIGFVFGMCFAVFLNTQFGFLK